MSKQKPAQLTDTQLVILAAAAQRDDNLIILPATLKGSAAQKVVTKLTTSGLLKEVRVMSDQPVWRTDETGHPVGLKITKAGESAIGIDDDSPAQPPSSHENSEGEPHVLEGKNTAATQEPRPGSKQALIVSLMQQAGGATLEALIKATDWLPHTTRAALTGLRKKGYTIEKTKGEDGKTVYALPSAASLKPEPQRRGSIKRKAA
jgi:hypothetical protein